MPGADILGYLMIIGFTGTREGMTEAQKGLVTSFLQSRYPLWVGATMIDEVPAEEAHHGDCVGSDEEFHGIALKAGLAVVLHPPSDKRLRAYCQGAEYEEDPLPYLQRNHAIVDACDLLLTTPREEEEPKPKRGQGTWSTLRQARRVRRAHLIFFPSGRVEIK